MMCKSALQSVGVFIIACAALPLVSWSQADSLPGTINVSGQGVVQVTPDEVVITFGVETSDKDLMTAKRQNDDAVKKVLALTKTFNIEPKYVQTDYMSIEPRYHDSYEKRDFIGYFVQKTIVVTLKDLGKFEDLLTEALVSGVNYVHGIEFRTTQLRKYRDQARALAIKAAEEKASDMAQVLHQKIGKPRSIAETQNWWGFGYSSWWHSSSRGQMQQNVISGSESSGASGEASLAPGQLNVSAQVAVSFELQ